MLNKVLAGVFVFGLVAGLAHAASDQAPPPPPAQADQGGNGGQGGWWGHRGHGMGQGRHGDMRGMMGQGGPDMMRPPMGGPMGGPPMMRGQGFRLQLGANVSVNLMCGQQPIKDCIADAQPLIDAAKAAAGAQAK